MPFGKLVALISLLAPALALAAQPARGSDTTEVVFLHFNDLHGYVVPREFLGNQLPEERIGEEVGSLFSAGTLVERWREKLFAKDPELEAHFEATGDDGIFFLDGGDSYSGTLPDARTQGALVAEVMNSPHLDIDAGVCGNHSWDFGQERWLELLKINAAHHPMLTANLRRKDGTTIEGLGSWSMLQSRGLKVAVIGLLAGNALHSAAPEFTEGLIVDDPFERLDQILAEIEAQHPVRPDLIVVLSHVAFERGADSFQKLAAMDDVMPGDDGKPYRNVDLIIDGHSHVEHEVKIDENSWLVQADHYGVKLGEVVLDYSRSAKRIEGAPRMRRVTLLTKEVPLHAGMMADHATQVAEARALEESILVPASPGVRIPALPRTALRELRNPSGDLFTRAMLEVARSQHGVDAQISLVNQTGVRAGLYSSKKGGITRGGVHAVAPFANQLVVLQVKASGLLKLLEKEGIQHRSKLSWAGLELVAQQKGTDRGAEMRRRIVQCDLIDPHTGGRTPLADLGDQPVTVVCPDFIAGRELKKIQVPDTRRDLRLMDREALEKFLEGIGQDGEPLDATKIQELLGTPVKLVIE